MNKTKQMRLRFVRFGIWDSVLADIYDTFTLYGERFCVTNSVDDDGELSRYFLTNHFKAGLCVGRENFKSITRAKEHARQRLLMEGKTNILKYIKKWPVINF